jgi:hypothetical protein
MTVTTKQFARALDHTRLAQMSQAWDEMARHTLHGGPEYQASKSRFDEEIK